MKLSNSKVELARRDDKVVYRDGNRLVKVFNDRKPGSDVFNEALNDARVAEAGGRVPKVLEVSQVKGGEWEGSWAIALTYIPGRTLENVIDEDVAHIDDYFEQFVDLQIQVQSADVALLRSQKDKLRRMIGSAKRVDPSVRYDLQQRLDGLGDKTRVCHGDFVPSNVIMPDNGSMPYVCDWAHVTAGAPEVDAAQTYLLFMMEHPNSAERYLSLYSKRSDTPRQIIMSWVPVVAAAELARGRKQHEKFLLGQVESAFCRR